MTLRCLCTYF